MTLGDVADAVGLAWLVHDEIRGNPAHEEPATDFATWWEAYWGDDPRGPPYADRAYGQLNGWLMSVDLATAGDRELAAGRIHAERLEAIGVELYVSLGAWAIWTDEPWQAAYQRFMHLFQRILDGGRVGAAQLGNLRRARRRAQ